MTVAGREAAVPNGQSRNGSGTQGGGVPAPQAALGAWQGFAKPFPAAVGGGVRGSAGGRPQPRASACLPSSQPLRLTPRSARLEILAPSAGEFSKCVSVVWTGCVVEWVDGG